MQLVLAAAFMTLPTKGGRMTAPTNNDLDRKDRPRSTTAALFALYSDLDATTTKEWLVQICSAMGKPPPCTASPERKVRVGRGSGVDIAAGKPWHGRGVKQGAAVFVALERRKLVTPRNRLPRAASSAGLRRHRRRRARFPRARAVTSMADLIRRVAAQPASGRADLHRHIESRAVRRRRK